MRLFILTAFLVFSLSQIGNAQQDPMFTKYMFNSLVFNPAYAGSHEYMSARVLYRNQWLDVEGAPTTQSFTIHTPANERVGVGLSVVNDNIGVHGSTSANLSYAYRFNFGNGKLSIGLQGGATNFRSNFERLNYRQPQSTDNVFNTFVPNQWLLNFGAGVFYYAPIFYVGFSAPQLFNQEYKRTTTAGTVEAASTYRHYYFTAGAALPISGDALIFKPSILIRNVGLFGQFAGDVNTTQNRVGAPTAFDIDLSFMFYETLWVGASFRSAIEKITKNQSSNDSIDIWASVYLGNGLRLGGAYDYTISQLNQYAGGSFEVMLGYDFKYEDDKVSHPRYF